MISVEGQALRIEDGCIFCIIILLRKGCRLCFIFGILGGKAARKAEIERNSQVTLHLSQIRKHHLGAL